MRVSGKQTKRAVSLLLCLALLVSMLAFALTVRAEEAEQADTGAMTYYLYGQTESTDFGALTEPAGTFSYDSSKGYYLDLEGAYGDYYFVISEIADSGSGAVAAPAVTSVLDGEKYLVTTEDCGDYECLHLLNPSGDKLCIAFTDPEKGIVVTKIDDEPTSIPETKPAAVREDKSDKDIAQTGADKVYVYCENEAGWSSVYAYMWIESPKSENAAWPGKQMTNIGDNIWRYEVTNSSWDMIIFNIGSSQTQTSNLKFPGKDYIYNNKTNQWSVYDTSPLQVTSYTTDLSSPQYNGVGITLSATAEGPGTVSYKFSVSNGSGTTVLSNFSAKNSAVWTPQTAGTYTLIYDFKDTKGNTNQRTKTYVIEDGSASVAPYIKTVTPGGGEIQNNTSTTFRVSAGGGMTGTNLLFYKYTVKNAGGTIVNVPYYTRNTSYSFKPTALGDYTLTVSVQGSDNNTVERDYAFTSVGTVSPTEPDAPTEPDTPTDPPVIPTEAPPVRILYGDADDDDDVNIVDVTFIQRYEAGLQLTSPINLINADVDGDEDVSIIDATLIQRYVAGIISKFPAES